MLSFVLRDVDMSSSPKPSEIADALYDRLLTLKDIQRRDREGETFDGFTDKMLEGLRAIDFSKVEIKLVRSESGRLVVFLC